MARQLRIEYPNACYHITSRGNSGNMVVRNDKDRQYFLELLGDVIEQFHWICYAYCLMSTHYHLVIETSQANLSRGMRQLNGVYTQRFNWRHKRRGHVFQGRFKAIIIDKDGYLLELSRYVVLNPVRAHMVEHPEDWKWSSYRATIGKAEAPVFFIPDLILARFSGNHSVARRLYAAFVMEGITRESPWNNLEGQIFLGDRHFIEGCKSMLSRQQSFEIPKPQRLAERPSLAELFGTEEIKKADRNALILKAHRGYGYTLQEIADILDIHYATASRIVRAGKTMLKYKT